MGSLEETTVNGLPSPLDPEEFRRQAHIVVDFIADYYRNVHNYPVRSQVSPGYLRGRLPESCPKLAEPLESILRDVRDHIMPGLTHWQSPNFFAYFPCCASTAGFLGEMLSVGFNVVGFNWAASPAATELETIVMDWLGQMLALPSSFLFSGGGGGGVLQATTTEAVLSTLAAARDKKLGEISGHRVNDLVVYCSDQTHCVLIKAAQVAGIQPENIRLLRTSRRDAFALSPDVLRAKVEADVATGRVPLYLCATVGTTSTAAVDPLRGLCAVAKAHGMWVHVDAAYAGGACICPEFRHMIDGVEDVDSFSLNAHKLLFTTLACSCLWLKEPQQLVDALSAKAEYLRNEGTDSKKVIDYMDWQIALSRRFRALKLWMVLRSFGEANLRAFVRRAVSLAELFEGLVVEDERFELVVPRKFSLVCFRLSPPITVNCGQLDAANEINRRLLEAVNATGKVFMTHSMVEGVYFIRFAVGGSLTEQPHVLSAWAVVQGQAEAVLAAAALE